MTCALEHFTSLMAEIVLGDDEVLAGAHPKLAALWRWHAAEENEHKSVAFDVYQAAGGNYVERSLVMLHTTVMFWSLVFAHQITLMKHDGLALSVREWAKLAHFLYVRPGGLRRIVLPYLRYFHPKFHPNDIDSREVVLAWKKTFDEGAPLQPAA